MTIDFDPTVDQYKVLGVDAKASAADIKKAYRKLAKQYHPDSTGGDKAKEARFKEISTAYEILSDPAKRNQYDLVRAQVAAGGFRGGGVPFGAGAPGGHGPQVWDLSDLFSQLFASAPGGRPGGGGVHVEVDDDWGPFAEARRHRGGGHGHRGPRGAARHAAAAAEPTPTETKVRAADGTWLTIRGLDVHSELRLPFADAILGTVRTVATLTGTASVKVPPGTSSGKKLRLRGKGVVGPTGDGGDHYVTIQIDVPGDLDDEARRKLVDLSQHLERLKKKAR